MKAAVLTGIRQLEIREVADPTLEGPRDVILRMRSVGVCGSDVHYYTTGRIGSQVVEYPFAVGHEGAADVVAVGAEVTRVTPGARVAVEPAVSCRQCDQCRAGRPHTCRTLKFLGCPGQLEGCFCEYIVMPEECCYPIPDSMTYEQAALSEPLAIGVYAAKQSIPLAGTRIGILGAGPIGLSVLLPALAQGAAAAYITDRLDYRCEIAARNGAAWVGNPDRTDIVAEIAHREPELLDAVFECCGQQEAMDQAAQLLKPGGKLMVVGIPQVERISFVPDTARRRELCFQHVRRQNHCVQPTLDAIAAGQFDPMFMVTHRFALEECGRAMDLVAEYGDGVVKAMISLDAE